MDQEGLKSSQMLLEAGEITGRAQSPSQPWPWLLQLLTVPATGKDTAGF